ncbi:MAG: hypothetical protein HWQ41_19290 [Nostoc sp. NOS(2021)]|uniref:hypothetical protein n=1 Tax=Nostoc sp. NOS(2021) TaxID=2815407 RepID=UPI0025F83040|nr:hypothetical protein [Nostoc sp. NOS(2021)]MBN3897340.1 hypothetical protein [Nostoc sp. NOS(2021)]
MSKNPHLGRDVFEHLEEEILPDTHETRLVRLIEACKIIMEDINQGRIDDAKKFLGSAVADAEKPYQSASDAMKALDRYLPPNT